MCFRDGLDYDSIGYAELCYNYKLQTLESRRKISDLCNLNKLYNNNYDSPYIVSEVLINVTIISSLHPRRDRLFSANSRINLRKYSFIQRVLFLANVHREVDIFEADKEKFKRSARDSIH